MKLINTDGMALIGPGSEWFWTALTGLILAVTFFAIYRQLSMARSATAFEQLTLFETELRSERMNRLGLEVALALREGVDPARGPQLERSPLTGNGSVASCAVGTWMRSSSGMGVAVTVRLGGSCSSQ